MLFDNFKNSYDYSLIKKEMFKNSNSKTVIPIKCKLCNNVFKRKLQDHFLLKYGYSFCAMSEGSKIVFNCLKKMNIDFEMEIPISSPYNTIYYFDFKFIQNDITYIIEYDGKSHFEFTPHWHKILDNFIKAQERDIYKQYYAIKNNFNMIRLDHKIKLNEIEEHIFKAFETDEKIYYSTENMYEWLENGVKNYQE